MSKKNKSLIDNVKSLIGKKDEPEVKEVLQKIGEGAETVAKGTAKVLGTAVGVGIGSAAYGAEIATKGLHSLASKLNKTIKVWSASKQH